MFFAPEFNTTTISLSFFADLVAAAVLSGNRNFEGRVHPLTRANYLASPPLVVAYAIAGTVSYTDSILFTYHFTVFFPYPTSVLLEKKVTSYT